MLTEAQRTWLAGLGIDAPALRATAPQGTALQAARGGAAAPPPKPGYLDFNSPGMQEVLRRTVLEQAERDRQEAEARLKKVEKALAGIQAYIEKMPADEMGRSGYAPIMQEVRRRYPELAALAQWVKDTQAKVPELRGKLPRPQAVMEAVETGVRKRLAHVGWSVGSGKDLATVAADRLLAAYMADLPAGVTVKIAGGVVQLSADGAALSVAAGEATVGAEAGKAGAGVSLTAKDYSIQVANDGWKEFDPQLRAEWKKIEGEASTVLKLRADRDQARLELEQKKKGGAELSADLSADFEKREAAFNLAWTKLQERVTATAKASEQKISASIAYLKKDKDDKDAVKAGLDAEVDLKAMQGKLQAYYKSPTLETVLAVTASAEKVTAKLEFTAVKSGVVVTANFEKALDETKAAIAVMAREGKTQLAAELKAKAEALSAKIKLVHETKDLKLAAELEKTLTDVRGSIELAYSKGNTTVSGGANVSSSGEAGGKVQIDIALKDGRSFVSDGDKLSFAANVSNKGYKFEVSFSMGEPVDTGSLQDLFATADRQIQELYKLAGDQGVRSIEDATALNAKLQEVMKPVKDAAAKARTITKKSDIVASFGFSLEGEWPAGGRAQPPAAMFGVKLMF